MYTKNLLAQKVGIIGGGQLGKMMINEASKMGIYTVVLDPNPDCPASSLADELIIANFQDKTALKNLAMKVDVLTYEFEHISTVALKELEEEEHTIYPSVKSLSIIQNKYNQKLKLSEGDVPIGKFKEVKVIEDIYEIGKVFGYPLMLKAALGAYDGKGNSLIRSEKDVEKSFSELGEGKLPLYVESFVDFTKEISVLCARGIHGDMVLYPVAENIHKNSILFETSVPAKITLEETNKALNIAKKVCEIFDGVGIFCVEMFLTKSGDIFVNEVAPRPHNSGHYTIEGSVTSQFENHIRAILGLPLGKTSLLKPTVMRNLLGEKGYYGEACVIGTEETLLIEGIKLHIYGKKDTKPNRKMGHLTVTSDTLQEAKDKAEKAYNLIKIISN